MPIITIDGPKMTREQKSELVKGMVSEASKVLNIPEEAFVMCIRENDPDNVGIGCKLLSDLRK
ncbi:MAG: 4-oxalocrotonate tautomerase DmpI [Candidatus Alkaliphilus sp. MAG34]